MKTIEKDISKRLKFEHNDETPREQKVNLCKQNEEKIAL